jgi:hypothetical protein
MVYMTSKATLRTQSWDLIHTTLSADTTITAMKVPVHSAYPGSFIEDADGLPFVVVEKPKVIKVRMTLGSSPQKSYTITMRIHTVVGGESKSSEKLKEIADLVESCLETNENTIAGSGYEDYEVLSDESDFDFFKARKIHYNILEARWVYYE